MKFIRFVATTALLASPLLLHAQETAPIMSVHVPFPFVVEGIHMPAGRYDISHLPSSRIWELHAFGHVPVEVPVTSGKLCKTPTASALVFSHDAGGYTLHQFLRSGESYAAQVVEPAGKRDQERPAAQVASLAVHAK